MGIFAFLGKARFFLKARYARFGEKEELAELAGHAAPTRRAHHDRMAKASCKFVRAAAELSSELKARLQCCCHVPRTSRAVTSSRRQQGEADEHEQ